MMKELNNKLEKSLVKSKLNLLNSTYSYTERKKYIKEGFKYKEYDETTFIISAFKYNGLFNETTSIRIVFNNYDYTYNVYNHFSYNFLDSYKFSELNEMINDMYLYLNNIDFKKKSSKILL